MILACQNAWIHTHLWLLQKKDSSNHRHLQQTRLLTEANARTAEIVERHLVSRHDYCLVTGTDNVALTLR
jgi:hypothetical protein